MMKFIVKLFFVCFFLLVILQFNRKTDSIQLVEFETAANKLVVKNPRKLILLCDSTIQVYKKSDNKKGIMTCMLKKLTAYNELNDYKSFADYSVETEKYAKNNNDKLGILNLLYIKAAMCKKLRLYAQGYRYLDEAIALSKEIPENDQLLSIKMSLFSMKSFFMGDEDKPVNEILNLRLAVIKEFEKIKDKSIITHPGTCYSNAAQSYIYKKDYDSAAYYFSKSEKISLEKNDYRSLWYAYMGFIDLHNLDGEYKKSLPFCDKLKELLTDAKITSNNKNLADYHKRCAAAYKGLKDFDQFVFHNDQYNTYKKRVLNKNEKLLVSSLKYNENKIIEKDKGWTRNLRIYYLILLCLAVLALAVILFFKLKLKKESDTKNLKEKKIEELEEQLNDAFAEVIELAKSNDSNFLTRFIEVYPSFYQKLIKNHPDLTAGEIRLCAFIYLNFTTKEIAYYEHLSLRSVENKKYRLRKKTGLEGQTDLHKWLMELED
ncbi:helix-turn-helix transcriptional regulator [Chryseobacterium sp. StRB126]|uniref:helix-turn-helix transcriptional regulator n=1 Tax=Chryseobacterium sp. StRB126 TaxID=878220 RepID=UPI0005EFCFA1|nr:hypothetical protein [Chryseobacterium sp. StRB126]